MENNMDILMDENNIIEGVIDEENGSGAILGLMLLGAAGIGYGVAKLRPIGRVMEFIAKRKEEKELIDEVFDEEINPVKDSEN